MERKRLYDLVCNSNLLISTCVPNIEDSKKSGDAILFNMPQIKSDRTRK